MQELGGFWLGIILAIVVSIFNSVHDEGLRTGAIDVWHGAKPPNDSDRIL